MYVYIYMYMYVYIYTKLIHIRYDQERKCPQVAVGGLGLVHPETAALYPEYRMNRTKTTSSRSLKAWDDKVCIRVCVCV